MSNTTWKIASSIAVFVIASSFVTTFADTGDSVSDTGVVTAATGSFASDSGITLTDSGTVTPDKSLADVSSGTTATGNALTSTATTAPTLSSTGADKSLATATTVGNYQEVACNKDYFKLNQCVQCFEGGQIAVGTKLTDLYDLWSNTMTGNILIYESQQAQPSLVNLGGDNTLFTQSPLDAKAFWKYGPDILWTQSVEKQGDREFELVPGKTVRLFEADMGASISLDKTDVANGTPVALLKFPVTYMPVLGDGTEGARATNTECVVYAAGAAAITPPAPVVETPAPAPKPKQLIKPHTGPEEDILVIMTLIVTSVIFYLFRRRRAS